MKKNINNRGFTLVELIAVIIILSIVTTIVVISANKIIKDSNEKTDKVTIQNIEEASHSYITKIEIDKQFTNNLINSSSPDEFKFYIPVRQLIESDLIRLKENNKYINYCATITKNKNSSKITSTSISPCNDETKYLYYCNRKSEVEGFLTCDVDMDSVISIVDASVILKFLAGKMELNDNQKILADVNKIEGINTGDSKKIMEYLKFIEEWGNSIS